MFLCRVQIIKLPHCSLRLVSLAGRSIPREGMRADGYTGGALGLYLGSWGILASQAGSPNKRSKRESGVQSGPTLLEPLREGASL